jgi:hypothetical protein
LNFEVEYTDEFGQWWNHLNEGEQESIDATIDLLIEYGPHLKFPYSSQIQGSKHSRLRELRIQHKGHPYRILYAFDPRRIAILLIGGNKTGETDWYEKLIPLADKLYDEHLKTLAEENDYD